MPKICYDLKNFGRNTKRIIALANEILDEYAAQGYVLTLRQLYYQFVAPPNPAKVTDSRFKAYVERYGDESWELDALQPTKFRELIEERLQAMRDEKQWKADQKRKATVKKELTTLAEDWDVVRTSPERISKLEKELLETRSKLDKLNKRRHKRDA